MRVADEFKIFTNVRHRIVDPTPLPAKIYSHEGLAQVLFFESDEECEVAYADRSGKYMRQSGITLPRA